MWCLKIRVRERWNIYNKRTVKFKVKLYFFSHNYYQEKKKLFYIASGIIEGSEKQRKKFLTDLKKDKKVKYIEWNNNFFICIYSELKSNARAEAVKIAYNPRIIFLKPVIIDQKGWEEWEIASTNKKDLNVFIHYAERLKNVDFKLFYLKKHKIENLMIYSIMPKLTERQRRAIELAVKNGYYGYPRKVKLNELAKQMKLSLSTYQFHLAKAEAKLIPFITKEI